MRSLSFGLAVLFALAVPAAARAQTWHGKIQCGLIPGLTTKALNGDFEMTVNGTRLSYSRPVHVTDSPALSGVAESGDGILTGNEITLRGGASARGYSYTASYHGRIEGGHAILSGEQLWTAAKLPEPVHRACRIRLTR
jgi:hypothetical protein